MHPDLNLSAAVSAVQGGVAERGICASATIVEGQILMIIPVRLCLHIKASLTDLLPTYCDAAYLRSDCTERMLRT